MCCQLLDLLIDLICKLSDGIMAKSVELIKQTFAGSTLKM